VNGIDLRFGDKMNVIWLAETTEQGRAAKALFDLPERGVALLNGQNHMLWHASSSTRRKLEAEVQKVLNVN
jgi:hypothetical protein